MPVYEEYQAPASTQAAWVSDVIPWRSMIAPGVLLQKYSPRPATVLCRARAGRHRREPGSAGCTDAPRQRSRQALGGLVDAPK